MPLTFTYEYPLIVRTSSATAPVYSFGNINARNTLYRARLVPEIQEIPNDLYEAAEHLIRNEPVPTYIQTRLYTISSKHQQLTYQDALAHLSQPLKGANSLVGVTATYEKYKQVNEVKLIKALAEEALLTKAVARTFNIRSLRDAGVDLSYLFSQDELKKFKISQEDTAAALYRLVDGQYAIYNTIPITMRGESIYVMGVEREGVEGNMMTSVVPGKEFDEYAFEYDEGDNFVVHLRICVKHSTTQSRSWNEEQEQCVKQVMENPQVCDFSIQKDANTGILGIQNYYDKGFTTLSRELAFAKQIAEYTCELKGWQALFQSIFGPEERYLAIDGAAPALFGDYVAWYIAEAKKRAADIKQLKYVDIATDPILFSVLCGSLAYKLDFHHLLFQPFSALAAGRFDTLDFVTAIYHLYYGINNTIRRLQLATKRTYLKKEARHHVNAVYAQWAGCQCYIQENQTNTQFAQQFCDSVYYQFMNPAETEPSSVKGFSKATVASLIQRYKNSQRNERIFDFADHLIGCYLHSENEFITADNQLCDYKDVCTSDHHQIVIELDITKSPMPFAFKLESSQEFPDYACFNQYIDEMQVNQYLRIINQQKRFFDVSPCSVLLPDAQLTMVKTEFQQRFSDYGYKIYEDESDTEDNELIQDIPKTYLPYMLEFDNGNVFEFDEDMQIVVPGQFIDLLYIYKLSDFRSVPSDMIYKLGFIQQELSLFIDLSDKANTLSPFLMYDYQVGHYYVPAFFNSFSNLMASNFGYSAQQISVLLTATVYQPNILLLDGQSSITNIMTLIDMNQVYRKLAQAIRDYRASNFSCFQFMGRKVQRTLERNNYLQTIRDSLACADGTILFYQPTNAEKGAIQSEMDFLRMQKRKTWLYIVEEKPAPVYDYLRYHIKTYEFAAYNLDKLLAILRDVEVHVTEYHNTSDQYFEYYSGHGDKKLEQIAFGYYEPVSSRTVPFEEVIRQTPVLSPLIADRSPTDIILSSRIRGVQLSYLLRNGLVSPDAKKLNVQKFFGFDSINGVFKRFGVKLTDYPISLQKMTSKALSTPLFYRLSALELTGNAPLKDVFGRTLRAQSPYSLSCCNQVENVPAPLENEPPPPPSASGEESTVEQIIYFWQRFQHSYYNIDQNTTRALLSPMFCLEQREYEVIPISGPAASLCDEQDAQLSHEKQNYLLACQCASVSYLLYPPNSSQIDSFMRGMYYMSPYFIPLCQDSQRERLQILQNTCNYAVSVICQLLRDGIDRYLNMPIITPQTRPPPAQFTDAVLGYFQGQCQRGSHEHIMCRPPMYGLLPKREIKPSKSRDFDFRQIQSSRLLEIILAKQRQYGNDKFALAEYVKNADFWPETLSAAERVQQLAPLIDLVLQSHPILNVLNYGESDDGGSATALDIHRFLSLGKLGKAEDEERALEERMQKKTAAVDEVYQQLITMQDRLNVLEQQNTDACIQASYALQQMRYLDMHDELCDIYAAVVNAAYSKACACDKKIHPLAKISADQQLSAGFETGGPDPAKVADWQNDELRELAERNGLSYGGFKWDHDGFDICDIVNFYFQPQRPTQ